MDEWRGRVDELLYAGESIEERIGVGDADVVVTTHRVLALTPSGDGERYRAIDRPNVLGASIDAGEVTMGEVISVLPFQNTLSTFEVTGAQILAALENGVSQVEEGAGRFPQVAGMSFAVDLSAEPGSRVSNVMVGDAPLDPDATYGAVSNNYVRNGGDGYRMFRDAMNAYDYGPDLADVTAEYLAANAPYTPYTDGRITVTP